MNRRTSRIILIAALLLAAVLLSLPAYSFTSTVYTKKSPNTFVGDDTYNSVKAEVEEIADEYRAQGFSVELDEDVIERTNSKNQTTSLVTFSLKESFTKNALSFLGSGLPSSYVLMAIILCLVLAAVFSFTDSDALKSASCILTLVAFLLVPVFVMMNTYAFSRKTYFYANDLLTEGRDEFYALLDRFLFAGDTGDEIVTAIKNLTYKNLVSYWLTLPCIFAALLCCIKIRYGEIKPKLSRGCLYAFVIIMCVIFLYPYYVMLITGFRSPAETNDMYFQHIFPTKWVWENMSHIVKKGVPRFLLNSLMIAGGATLVAMFCGIPAAYAMARMRFRGKKAFLGFIIMSQMFAPVVLLIGIAQLMNRLALNDTIVGLMLINAAFNQAFAIWLLRGTFVSISPEMEQAALIDGCNTFQSLIKVLLPMAAPGIVTALIFVFINSWNEYTISTVLISTASNKPITVGITTFSSFNMIEWQYLFAASLLATIPVVILFAMIEKHLTAGLTAGGVKG